MHEKFFVWHDEWGREGEGDSEGERGVAVPAAATLNDDEIDEYVRLYGHTTTTPCESAAPNAIDLQSDEEKEAMDLKLDEEKVDVDQTDEDDPPPSKASIQAALARFGHSRLRGLQELALRSVFAGRDTIVLLPTGGGKSLCFQLPAVMQPGLVVVISPLLALMQDQVVALRKRGIRVEMLCSLASAKEKRLTHDRLQRDAAFPGRADRVEILYTTPETLPTMALQATLKALHRRNLIALFAIDEAHCISSWGHDFRPAYLKLGAIRDTFDDVPIMALTATATDRVRADIHGELGMRDDTVELLGDFNRANITYSAHGKDSLGDDVGALLKYIQRCHRGSVGIVYVHRRLDTEALVEGLQRRDETIRAAPYHAEIPLKQREQILLDWLKGKIDIICATIAFGMGIDHPAVRFVVHWNMPKSLENLYQEAGRAGRDGHPSHHVLFYSYEEYAWFQELLRSAEAEVEENERKGRRVNRKRVVTLKERLDRLYKVMEWATLRTCRRQLLLKYFGQEISVARCAGTCDHCNPNLLFDKLPVLESHRPAANTYRLKPGEAPYKWRRHSKQSESTELLDESVMEAVPRYRGPALDGRATIRMPNFDLNMGTATVSPIPAPRAAAPRTVPTRVSPPPARTNGRQTFEQRIPAGVRTIADYIAATTEDRATPWPGANVAHRRAYKDTVTIDSDEQSEGSDDDVKWVDPGNVKREGDNVYNRTPPRPAKRQRRVATSNASSEVIVIDSD